jgi:hypothetical protein
VCEKYKIEEKLVCYTADITNSNFGGVKRKGEGNVFRKVRSDLDRPILGFGCSAHIVHNSVQTACDSLPLDIEVIVIKLYKYFHICTVRVTKLQQFCESVETDYKKVLSHSSTRFFSLLPAIERILAIFDGLKSYFLSCDKCPKLLFDFFGNLEGELYLKLLYGTLQLFNNVVLKLGANSITATEAFQTYYQLICQLQERKPHKFIPSSAKELLCTLKENNDVQEQKCFSSVDSFYNSSIQYLELWRNSFDKVSKFETEIARSDLQESAQVINAIIKDLINIDDLFDERTLLNKVIQYQKVSCGSSSEKVPDTIQEK